VGRDGRVTCQDLRYSIEIIVLLDSESWNARLEGWKFTCRPTKKPILPSSLRALGEARMTSCKKLSRSGRAGKRRVLAEFRTSSTRRKPRLPVVRHRNHPRIHARTGRRCETARPRAACCGEASHALMVHHVSARATADLDRIWTTSTKKAEAKRSPTGRRRHHERF